MLRYNFFISFLLLSHNLWSQVDYTFNTHQRFKSEIKVQKLKNSSEVTLDISMPSLKIFPSRYKKDFIEFDHDQLQFMQKLGAPKVPFVAFFISAYPEELSPQITEVETHIMHNYILTPAQKEPCRCDDNKKFGEKYFFNRLEYSWKNKLVSLEYLGKFRGTPITRVLVKLAKSDFTTKRIKVFTKLQLKIRSSQEITTDVFLENREKKQNNKLDYIIVGQKFLTLGLSQWKERKEALGYKIKIINIEGEDALDAQKLHKIFKSEYKKNTYRYALLVGDATMIGTNIVKTQWSEYTQSDYSFFLMDGKTDIIPDVFYGRIVANSQAEVRYQANKWYNYELEQTAPFRARTMIGIASNEGDSPSDDEYVTSIENMLHASYGTEIVHFNQNDPASNPESINQVLNEGADWLTYMGHGDGQSWGSTYTRYSVKDIKNLKNDKVIKPILIDVACQNGQLNKGNFGERMVNEGMRRNYFWRYYNDLGAALYYGGSVNISWHPPAIMAQGMIEEQISKKLQHIGEIILSGHLYLLKKYSDIQAIKENFSWYHLFGDPGTKVKFSM